MNENDCGICEIGTEGRVGFLYFYSVRNIKHGYIFSATFSSTPGEVFSELHDHIERTLGWSRVDIYVDALNRL